MVGVSGQIGELVRVRLEVVKLLKATGVVDVSIAVVGERVRRLLRAHILVEDKGSEGRMFAGYCRVFELGDQRGSGALFRDWEAGKFTKSRIEVGEGCRLVCGNAVLGNSRGMDEERGVGGLMPEGKFLPIGFFADVKPVIGPKNDDGVVFHWRGLKRIEESPELVVDIADAGEVALHERSPLVVVSDPLMPGDAVGGAGVGEIVFDVGRELDFIERI